MHTGGDLFTDKQKDLLTARCATEEHVEVEATQGIYQRMVDAYREPDRKAGRQLLVKLIDSLSRGVPKALENLTRLGRTLKQRADDVLAYLPGPAPATGPPRTINGRLEHLRGSARGFRDLNNYIARSLLQSGGSRPELHPGCEEPH